jgi:hypothetical protein
MIPNAVSDYTLTSLKSVTGRMLKAIMLFSPPKARRWPCTRTYTPTRHSALRCCSYNPVTEHGNLSCHETNRSPCCKL